MVNQVTNEVRNASTN